MACTSPTSAYLKVAGSCTKCFAATHRKKVTVCGASLLLAGFQENQVADLQYQLDAVESYVQQHLEL